MYPLDILKTSPFSGRKFEEYRINDKIASLNYTYYVMENFYYIYCESPVSITRGQKFNSGEFLWLDVLKTRTELFKSDLEISTATMILFCTSYIELTIAAAKNNIERPNEYHKLYKEFVRKIYNKINLKKRIRFIAFAINPALFAKLFILKG